MSGASEDSADTVLSVPSFGRMHRYHHDNRTFGRSLLQHEMEMRFLTLSSPTSPALSGGETCGWRLPPG